MFGNKNGIIVYKGKSMIDGKNIVAIATIKKNKNRKIGDDVVQIWILRADIDPILAKRLGEDYSICGDCKHRDFGTCYVNLGHGPNSIFKAFHNDKYIELDNNTIEFFRDKIVRVGAYGDPAAIPIEVINNIYAIAKNILSYTHQWNKDKFQGWKKYCMASVETVKEFNKAQMMGWRTFRIRLGEEPIFDTEISCPASEENNNKTSCNQCNSCNGLLNLYKKSTTIKFHRYGIKNYILKRYVRGIKALLNKKKYRVDFGQRRKLVKELCKI